ncbi:aromatic prenyltransferase [Aspergillus avenaceus]|uniref:Aromatic prenyltransferase n=1 Tax=Aspergillus avenaceus TaxID=36643 RepID=A0A5N6U4E1_ASPAV|nr:aromatic prenyltransferase [Aspergillus avenaceus]
MSLCVFQKPPNAPEESDGYDDLQPYHRLTKVFRFTDFDQSQWWNNTGSMLAKLFSQCGYSLDQQYQYLCMYGLNIIPFLGPWPHPGRPEIFRSVLSGLGTIEMSQNFTKSGRTVRLGIEPASFAASTGRDIYNRHAIGDALLHWKQLGIKIDLTMYHELVSEITLTDEDEEALRKNNTWGKQPDKTQNLLGLDFKGDDVVFKMYFYPQMKSLATGISRAQLLWNAVRKVDKDGRYKEALSMVEDYFNSVPEDVVTPYWTSCDLIEPHLTRFKFYISLFQVDLEHAMDLWTLGGRISSPESIATFALVRELWEALGVQDGLRKLGNYPLEVDIAANVVPMLFNIEIIPGNAIPRVKAYFSTTGMNDLEVAQVVTEFLRRHGMEKHAESYVANLVSYVPWIDLNNVTTLQAWVSLAYTEKEGLYVSLYYH